MTIDMRMSTTRMDCIQIQVGDMPDMMAPRSPPRWATSPSIPGPPWDARTAELMTAVEALG